MIAMLPCPHCRDRHLSLPRHKHDLETADHGCLICDAHPECETCGGERFVPDTTLLCLPCFANGLNVPRVDGSDRCAVCIEHDGFSALHGADLEPMRVRG